LSTPEGIIQLQILKYLKGKGCACGKTKTMGVKRGRFFCFDPYCFRGFPDIVAFYKSRLYFVEVKSKVGRQSEDQKKFQLLAEGAGLAYILARSVEDVSKYIK
jgi:VRR-NUC domain.